MAGKLWIKPSDLGQYFVFMYDMVLPGLDHSTGEL